MLQFVKQGKVNIIDAVPSSWPYRILYYSIRAIGIIFNLAIPVRA